MPFLQKEQICKTLRLLRLIQSNLAKKSPSATVLGQYQVSGSYRGGYPNLVSEMGLSYDHQDVLISRVPVEVQQQSDADPSLAR